ncbi:MAG: monovalent cation/H+ antiporter complex subunit F [Halobacteriaceae archaeon]
MTEATNPAFLDLALQAALIVAAGLTLVASYRVIQGPTTPDRVVALDTIGTNVVAIGVLVALQSGRSLFITVGLVLGVIGFLSTVAVAKFVVQGDIIE